MEFFNARGVAQIQIYTKNGSFSFHNDVNASTRKSPATISMTIALPQSKHDVETAQALTLQPPSQLEPHITTLLTWLQDFNWPVARIVRDALLQCGTSIVPGVQSVLCGDDSIHKYWILTKLLPLTDSSSREACMPQVLGLIDDPSPHDVEEDVHSAAKDLVVLHNYSRQQSATVRYDAKW
ncbi:DUF5071 domain-containing protein [Rubinisphaera margarita]|uniref:DUF5071 domain-containing protein n=1 Tax=Rubinisphaera margarita TaxID=2909586 RepID=UPI001EE7E031|nr:DUF5071 domain-containing protein [Rubinisphaera margarita]MCG6155645.1 DUF5071 domain-containing protein [Rubinisphaera margarita]